MGNTNDYLSTEVPSVSLSCTSIATDGGGMLSWDCALELNDSYVLFDSR
jgi:hypothetical protein